MGFPSSIRREEVELVMQVKWVKWPELENNKRRVGSAGEGKWMQSMECLESIVGNG